MFVGYVWPFLIYFLIVFVVSYIVVEYGQNYFYDEVTPAIFAKVAFGSFLLAIVLTWTRSNFATMFTSDLPKTVGLAIAWSGIFILVYRFQPWHGFGLAMATLLLFPGLATLVVDSMLSPRPPGRMDVTTETKPVRRATGGGPTSVPTPTPPTAK